MWFVSTGVESADDSVIIATTGQQLLESHYQSSNSLFHNKMTFLL